MKKVDKIDKKKKIMSIFGLNVPIFNQSKIRCNFPDQLGSTSEIYSRSLEGIYLSIALRSQNITDCT